MEDYIKRRAEKERTLSRRKKMYDEDYDEEPEDEY